MLKIILGIALLVQQIGIAQITYESTLSITGQLDTKESIYTDSIMQVYNASCIETSNYQYVFLNNSDDVLDGYGNITKGNWQDIDVMIKPIKEIGKKSLLADVWV